MALPASVTDINTIPEIAREHYTEGDDGTFTLQLGDVTGLQSALKSERENARKFEADMKQAKKDLEAIGATPEEINTLRTEIQALKDAGVKDADGIEALVAAKTQKLQKDIADRDAALAKAQADKTEQERSHTSAMIRTLAMAAAAEAGCEPTAYSTVADKVCAVFNHVSPDGKLASIRDADGYATKASDQVTDLTISTYLKETLLKECPFLWPPSKGGGAKGGDGPDGSGSFANIKDPVARLNALRAAGRTQ